MRRPSLPLFQALTLTVTTTLAAGESPAQLDFARGVLEQQRGQGGAAAALFEKARSEDPLALPLVERGVAARMAAGDLAGASTLYRELAAKRPERLDVQLMYADFLRNSSPGDDFAARMAGETLEAALKRFPGDLSIQRRLFRLYEQREKREQSTAIYDALVASGRRDGATVRIAAEMARTLFPKDDAKARERIGALYREAVAATPQDGGLAREASDYFRNGGDLTTAVRMLEAHVAAVPSSLELRTRLGILLLAASRQEEGEKILLEVLAIDPRQALAHQSLAKLYRKQEKEDQARPHAAEALKIRGGDPSEFRELADEFLQAGLPREARLLLEKAVFYHPDDAELLARLAIASRRDPETRTKASRLFREAEQLSGDKGPAAEPEFLAESAESLLEGGQKPAAEDRLRRAIRAFPADRKKEAASALRRLAGLWNEEGKNAEAARSLLQRAQALDPAP